MATAQTTPNLDDAFSQAAQQDQHPSSTPNMDDAFSQAAKGGVSGSGTVDAKKDTPQPGLMQQGEDFLQNVTSPINQAVGFAKGVGDTVHGIGTLIQKGGNLIKPGLGDKIVPPVGSKALDQADEASGPGQYAGKAMENILEFMGGEGAASESAKALSMGDKFAQLGDIGKFLEKHEVLAKMLATSAKTGAVTGVQTTAKTGSPEAGVAAGATGAVAGAAGEAAGAGVKYIRNLYRPLMDVTEGTIDPALGTVDPSTGTVDPKTGTIDVRTGIKSSLPGPVAISKGTIDPAAGTIDAKTGIHSPLPGPKNVRSVQPVLQTGIRDVIGKVADEAGVDPVNSSSIRDVVKDTAKQIKQKSQPLFQKIDDLSEGKLSDAQARAARYRGSPDMAGKDAYAKALSDQDKAFDVAIKRSQIAEADGVGPALSSGDLAGAKASWKQYRSLQEVSDAIENSTVGQRPAISEASAAAQPQETVNPKGLSLKLNKLYNAGVLQTALGEENANQLLDHAGASQNAVEAINEHNKQYVQEVQARNARIVQNNTDRNANTVEKNKQYNAQTIAGNRAANDALANQNKSAQDAVIAKNKQHNLEVISGNKQKNIETIEANKLKNQQTIARNQAANTETIEKNKAVNESKLAKRRALGYLAGTAAVGAGSVVGGHFIKDALSGQK